MKPREYTVDKSRMGVHSTKGYEYFCDSSHPLARKQGIVDYHRHVASVKLGRWLLSTEHVHHIDGNRKNNHPDNLQVLSLAEHNAIHHSKEPVDLTCEECGSTYSVAPSKKARRKHCSQTCKRKAREVIDWPPTDWLERVADEYSFLHLSRKLGVSDNAIRKRIKHH